MSDKQCLLREIQICDFNLLETALYLDSHKNDCEALKYYNKHNKMAKELKEKYVKEYGPLVISDSTCEKTWEWVKGPWPWEYSSN